MSVSVVIPFKNRPLIHIENFLKSVSIQTTKVHEIIFVDCASKQEIAEGLDKLCNQYNCNARRLYIPYPKVFDHKKIFGGIHMAKIHITEPPNPAFYHEVSKIKNIGIRNATGEYVATMSCDLIFDKNVIAEILRVPNKLVMCGRRNLPNINLNNIKLPDDFDRLWNLSIARGGRAMQCIPKEWLVKVRGFDERMKFNNDLDIEARARRSRLGVRRLRTRILHQWHLPNRRLYGRRNPYFKLLMNRRQIERRDHTIIRNDENWGREPVW